MTREKDFKTLVRSRVAKTGERYSTARAALLGELVRKQALRARHDQTWTLARLFQSRSANNPHTNQPFDEAWLLGLGGGLGFQYFVFEYSELLPILYLGTRIGPQYAYTPEFVVRAAERAGFSVRVLETTSEKKASANLSELLAEGSVAAWVGREALQRESAATGATPWVVTVHDIEEGQVALEDAFRGPFEIALADFQQAQAAFRKGKRRLVGLTGAPASDLRSSVKAALHDCVDDLAGKNSVRGYEKNFGLGALEKWAERVEAKDKKGWRTVFSPGARFVAGAIQAYHWLEVVTGGGAFRGLYADFLSSAGTSFEEPSLAEAAREYRRLSQQWSDLSSFLVEALGPLAPRARSQIASGESLTVRHPWLQQLAQEADEILQDRDIEPAYEELARRLRGLLQSEQTAARLLEKAASLLA